MPTGIRPPNRGTSLGMVQTRVTLLWPNSVGNATEGVPYSVTLTVGKLNHAQVCRIFAAENGVVNRRGHSPSHRPFPFPASGDIMTNPIKICP